jgi:glutamate-1-semialdehyde 2,1-aminomutase
MKNKKVINIDRSNELLELSKRFIPGGNTFNKTNYFDQGKTPFALTHGRGAQVWDIDGNQYTDYILGLGSIALGYCFDEVNIAMHEQLRNGVSFSLSNPLELEVTQKLVDRIPCAEMVRFGKNGSDVLTAAVRLARHITKRDHVAYCGYHGWHDWSISETSRPGGIPEAVRKLSHRFIYNDIDSLHTLVNQLEGQVSCVVMDVVARYYPIPGYLEEVKELCEKHGIILIFDEIITGFRMQKGSAQACFDVIPDLACFGKAMANGMPLSALVGSSKYMSRMDELFYSLTFSGESLSLAAANASLDFYKNVDVPKDLHTKGVILKKGFELKLEEYGLDNIFEIQGMESRIILGFINKDNSDFLNRDDKIKDKLTSSIIEQLCDRKILSNLSFFISYSHTLDDIKHLLNCFQDVCISIQKFIR